MSETTQESRRISTMRTETKVAVIVGLAVIGLAAYFYFTPTYLLKVEGGVFGCGSPASPNTEAANICGIPEQVNRARAYTAFGVGLMIVVLGFALFGLGGARNLAAEDEFDEDRDDEDIDDEDIDLRSERGDEDRTRSERGDEDRTRSGRSDRSSLRAGTPAKRSRRSDDDIDLSEDRPDDELESRSGRRGGEGRRRPRRDDDWASDSWR